MASNTSSIGTKLLFAHLLALALVIAGGGIGMFSLQDSIARYKNEVRELNEAQIEILRVETRFKTQVQEWKNVLLRGKDGAKLEKYWKAFEEEEAAVRKQAAAVMDHLPAGNSKKLITDFLAAHQKLGDGYRAGLQAFKAAASDAAAGDAAVAGFDRAPTKLLTEAVTEISKIATATQAEADAKARTGLTIALVAMALALIGGIALFATLIRRTIVQPTHALVAELQLLASGSLGTPLVVEATGEIAALAESTETLRQHLVTLIGNAKQSSDAVFQCSADMHLSATAIMNETEAQSQVAASLAATMEQMSAVMQAIAEESNRASQDATEASQSTVAGQNMVSTLIADVRDVAAKLAETNAVVSQFVASARNIGSLTQQVKEIADQTNLLALNAAIEAARAGEQGRGFAVVADEVRKLAEKSSKSADEIEAVTRLLETNTAAVEQAINDGNTRLAAGVELSNDVAEKLSATIVASDAVSRSVRSMAENVRQQNSAIDDVSGKTEMLARQSEENAAAVQQIQGNVDQMQQFSQILKQSMDSFTLGASR